MICLLGACIIAAQLTGGGLYHEDTPKTSVDFKGNSHDISKFYEADKPQFNIGGYIILDTDTRIDLQYDNGLESEKRQRSKSLSIGITQVKVIDEDSYITFGVSTRLGGSVKEVACRDINESMFFCDNLATLLPFTQPKNERDLKVSFSYHKSFNWALGTKETIGVK